MSPETRHENPYKALSPKNFWRTAVAEVGPFGVCDIHRAKFKISQQDKIVTAGSCFAQTIGQSLQKTGYHWFNAEPAPQFLSPENIRRFNYDVFSFRTGNIYSVALLRQWLEWALGDTEQSDEVWVEEGRYFDPVRPAIEPNGFSSRQEVFAARARTFSALRTAVQQAQVFVFTLGLTEAWVNRKTGLIYPMCPGTQRGQFDTALHEMINFTYAPISRDMERVLDLLRRANPMIKVLLTVSPVPLTATAEAGSHALVANTYTKSTLRAVAGDIGNGYDFVDYFPSYELMIAPSFRGMFYNPNARTIAPEGVELVMKHFYASFFQKEAPPQAQGTDTRGGDSELVCDEMILDFYNAG